MEYVEVRTQAELDKALKTPGTVPICVGAARFVAYDSASVRAYGSASVRAYDSASVEAYGSASVEAYGSASVEAYGSASVRAYDSASVEAYGSASVRASKYVATHRHVTAYGTPNVTGGVIIEVPVLTDGKTFCEFYGVEVKRGVAIVYKAVGDDYKSRHGTVYAPGDKPSCDDWNPQPVCGGGLHFSPRPHMAKRYDPSATRFVACPVRLSELVVIDDGRPDKVKAPRVCGPIFEVDGDGERVEQEEAA